MSHTLVTDRKLPGLATALDGAAMRPRLRPLLDAQGELAIELLKHVAGKRAVLVYRFDDGQQLIGKMYRKDRAPLQGDLLAALHAGLNGSPCTPRPLACWPDLGLVIQEHMPGEAAPHWSEMSGHEDSMDRMADALADLHAVQVDLGRQADLADHIRRACHPGLQALGEALPDLAPAVRGLEADLLERARRTPVQQVVCHGDFGPGQVLLTPQQVSIVDLDGLSRSDAALDVGNFMVGLRVHAGVAAASLEQRFLARYLRRRHRAELAGLPHYLAFAFLRRAMILLRKRPVGWEEQSQQMVEQARSSL